jgi:hypothetical protein
MMTGASARASSLPSLGRTSGFPRPRRP